METAGAPFVVAAATGCTAEPSGTSDKAATTKTIFKHNFPILFISTLSFIVVYDK